MAVCLAERGEVTPGAARGQAETKRGWRRSVGSWQKRTTDYGPRELFRKIEDGGWPARGDARPTVTRGMLVAGGGGPSDIQRSTFNADRRGRDEGRGNEYEEIKTFGLAVFKHGRIIAQGVGHW